MGGKAVRSRCPCVSYSFWHGVGHVEVLKSLGTLATNFFSDLGQLWPIYLPFHSVFFQLFSTDGNCPLQWVQWVTEKQLHTATPSGRFQSSKGGRQSTMHSWGKVAWLCRGRNCWKGFRRRRIWKMHRILPGRSKEEGNSIWNRDVKTQGVQSVVRKPRWSGLPKAGTGRRFSWGTRTDQEGSSMLSMFRLLFEKWSHWGDLTMGDVIGPAICKRNPSKERAWKAEARLQKEIPM